jgi:DNA repair exonuclease SbcCD nuclease subunit
MKFVLLSDLHLLWTNPVGRLDDVHETQKEKLRFVLGWAKDNEAVVLQAGDFFDRPRSWHLLPEVMGLLKEFGVDVYAVFGQHDTYMYSEGTRQTTSLGILEKAGLVQVIDSVEYCSFLSLCNEIIQVCGASYGQEIPEISGLAQQRILVIHKSISDAPLWPGHEYSDAEGFLEKHKQFDLILCGDIHRKFFVLDKYEERVVCNTGCMVRKTVDLWDHKPCFFVWDSCSDEFEEVEIPHKPPEEVMSRVHLDRQKEESRMLDEFTEMVKAGFEVGGSFEDNLAAFMRENKVSREVMDLISREMSVEGKEL